MRQIIYVRMLWIGDWPGADAFRRIALPRVARNATLPFERNVTPRFPGDTAPRFERNITPRTGSRSIPVRVRGGHRGESWMDRARRVLARLGLRTGA